MTSTTSDMQQEQLSASLSSQIGELFTYSKNSIVNASCPVAKIRAECQFYEALVPLVALHVPQGPQGHLLQQNTLAQAQNWRAKLEACSPEVTEDDDDDDDDVSDDEEANDQCLFDFSQIATLVPVSQPPPVSATHFRMPVSIYSLDGLVADSAAPVTPAKPALQASSTVASTSANNDTEDQTMFDIFSTLAPLAMASQSSVLVDETAVSADVLTPAAIQQPVTRKKQRKSKIVQVSFRLCFRR